MFNYVIKYIIILILNMYYTYLHMRWVNLIFSLTMIAIHTYPSFPAVTNITRRSDLTNHNASDTACECHSKDMVVMLSFMSQINNSPANINNIKINYLI